MVSKTIRLQPGSVAKVSNQWEAEAEAKGTTVSTSVWETTAGSLSGAALADSLATVLLTEGGSGYITNTVTLANGEKLVSRRRITIDAIN